MQKEDKLITLWKKKKIFQKHNYIFQNGLKDLDLALIILKISKQEFDHAWMTAEEISLLLVEVFHISSSPITIKRAFANAGGSNRLRKPVIFKKENSDFFYKISQPGEVSLELTLGKDLLKALYLGPNSHSVAYQSLQDMIKKMKGNELRISDPYYGSNTLNVIEDIVRTGKKVKFLTYKTNEPALKFKAEFNYLRRHYKNKIEVKVYSKNELHDRYILCDDSFAIVGHGIKDLGNKESLVVVIDDKFGKNVRQELNKAFWIRWGDSNNTVL